MPSRLLLCASVLAVLLCHTDVSAEITPNTIVPERGLDSLKSRILRSDAHEVPAATLSSVQEQLSTATNIQTSDGILEQSGSQTMEEAPVTIDIDTMMADSEAKAKRELKDLEEAQPGQKTLFKAAKTKYRSDRKHLRQQYRGCKKQLRKTGLGAAECKVFVSAQNTAALLEEVEASRRSSRRAAKKAKKAAKKVAKTEKKAAKKAKKAAKKAACTKRRCLKKKLRIMRR